MDQVVELWRVKPGSNSYFKAVYVNGTEARTIVVGGRRKFSLYNKLSAKQKADLVNKGYASVKVSKLREMLS